MIFSFHTFLHTSPPPPHTHTSLGSSIHTQKALRNQRSREFPECGLLRSPKWRSAPGTALESRIQ